jgi:hypothetical protein
VTMRLPPLSPEVLRAMARWPDVPRCHGWLGLDRRGCWRLKGEPITHAGSVRFLGEHYRPAADGSWYVQNGPQQVFVTLAYTPWVYRLDGAGGFLTHTGLACGPPERALLDDEGNLLLVTPLGVGLLDDRDLAACAAGLEPADSPAPTAFTWGGRRLALEFIARAEVARRFAFVPVPTES